MSSMYITKVNYKTIYYNVSGDKSNVSIIDSYLIKEDADKNDFIKHLHEIGLLTGRSEISLWREWKAHNILYQWGMFKERTQNTDLNENESWFRRLGYFFISLLFKE